MISRPDPLGSAPVPPVELNALAIAIDQNLNVKPAEFISNVPALVLTCKYKMLSFKSLITTSSRINAAPFESVVRPVWIVVCVSVRTKSSPAGSLDRQQLIFVAPDIFASWTSRSDASTLIELRAKRSCSKEIAFVGIVARADTGGRVGAGHN
jgi:hypothetical protein